MARTSRIKTIARSIFALRIPGNPLHRALAWEYQLRHFALYEAARILYYQPMFESRCARVGSKVRLELCPDSKLPPIFNADVELGDRVRLSARTTFSGARNAEKKPRIVIGDDSYVGHRVALRAGTELIIGKHVLIASNAVISGDPGHPLDAIARRTEPAPRETLGRIVIGDDAWIAYNVSIVGNVTIGEGAIVAAGSVVTKDVPAYALAAGNPARVIRLLKDDEVKVRAAPPAPAGENAVRVPPEKNDARQQLKSRYLALFTSAQGGMPTEEQLEAVVDRALHDLGANAPGMKRQTPATNEVLPPSQSNDVSEP